MDAKQEVEKARVESEATRDQPLPEHVKGARRGRSVVQSVRLPAEAFAAIEEVAERAGVPVSALIRGWVQQGLASEQGMSLRDRIDRLAADADRLRRLAAAREVASPLVACVDSPVHVSDCANFGVAAS
ncbi:MAG: hypothetical protein M3319_05695 [Actinomycetota bacterium]|nr:hypothetical protein [Actinomycetota bacterium]